MASNQSFGRDRTRNPVPFADQDHPTTEKNFYRAPFVKNWNAAGIPQAELFASSISDPNSLLVVNQSEMLDIQRIAANFNASSATTATTTRKGLLMGSQSLRSLVTQIESKPRSWECEDLSNADTLELMRAKLLSHPAGYVISKPEKFMEGYTQRFWAHPGMCKSVIRSEQSRLNELIQNLEMLSVPLLANLDMDDEERVNGMLICLEKRAINADNFIATTANELNNLNVDLFFPDEDQTINHGYSAPQRTPKKKNKDNSFMGNRLSPKKRRNAPSLSASAGDHLSNKQISVVNSLPAVSMNKANIQSSERKQPRVLGEGRGVQQRQTKEAVSEVVRPLTRRPERQPTRVLGEGRAVQQRQTATTGVKMSRAEEAAARHLQRQADARKKKIGRL